MALGAPGPTPEQLHALLTLAARAPDHGKLAPWRFLVIQGEDKARCEEALDVIAQARPDASKARAKLAKLKSPPLAVAVVSCPVAGEIPEWEQVLSAGAVCALFIAAAQAMGFGANWITDWYAYDPAARGLLGLSDTDKVAGFILLGTPAEAPLERVRPDLGTRVAYWRTPTPGG
jgi:nitroreductase